MEPLASKARGLAFVLLQLDIAYGNPQRNMDNISQAFIAAKPKPGDIAVLPELWNTSYDLERLPEIADKDGAETRRLLSQLAQQYRIYIMGGSIARLASGKYFNTTYCFDPQGEEQGRYDKVHLFGPMSENRYLTAGDRGLIVLCHGARVAPVICYDVRFPEWLRTIALEGVDVFVVSAQWPGQRIRQWRTLLQARAIENQAYVVAVNRRGRDPENYFPGQSIVVAPSGDILTELTEAEESGRTTLGVSEAYANIPVFADRRADLYR